MKKYLIFTLLLSGCATFFIQKSPIFHFEKGDPIGSATTFIKRTCMNSDGKGKLVLAEEDYQFSYESFLNKKQKFFAIGANFPMVGQEVLKFNYKKNTVSGSFYERLSAYLYAMEDEGVGKEVLDKAGATINKFVKLKVEIESGNHHKCKVDSLNTKKKYLVMVCEIDSSEFTWTFKGKELLVSSDIEGGYRLDLTFQDYNKERFRRWDILLSKKTWFKDYELFSMIYLATQCE
jgi:hypothetical protein